MIRLLRAMCAVAILVGLASDRGAVAAGDNRPSLFKDSRKILALARARGDRRVGADPTPALLGVLELPLPQPAAKSSVAAERE